jgi:sensor c-di-GMP phosphodiesterase-like protein
MRRRRVVAWSIAAALVAASAAMAATLVASWLLARHNELASLSQFTQRVTIRAETTFAEVAATLKALNELQEAPCSKRHIESMRRASFDTPTVEEVGYFADGFLRCTSWGEAQPGIARTKVDFTLRNGLQVTVALVPGVSRGRTVAGLHYGRYNALVDPRRFVDVVTDRPEMQLAVMAADGQLLGSMNAPDPGLLRQILAAGSEYEDASRVAVVARHPSGLVAVAIEPRSRLVDEWKKTQWVTLPLGGLLAAALVGLVALASRRQLSPLGQLAAAVRERRFIVYYQPLVELATGNCIGAEALVRMRDADGGLVRPDLFIPAAEESGLILPITDQVIEGVVADLRALLPGRPDLHIAINLSAADVVSGRALSIVTKALAGTGILPAQIWLEATERGFMNATAARLAVKQARDAGHVVAIDDFGTGYSSLSQLQSLALDVLKIDKAFVDTVGTEAVTSSITPHIIDMARSLGLRIVAEGVERENQAAYLRERGVDYGQGWLYGKPMPAADFIAYCARPQAARS